MDNVFGLNTLRQEDRLRSLGSQSAARTILLVCPTLRRGIPNYLAATSFALRLFENQLVTRVANEEELAEFAARFPDARLKVLCREGYRLSEELQDSKSYRYAVLNLGGQNRADTLSRREAALWGLPFACEAVRRPHRAAAPSGYDMVRSAAARLEVQLRTSRFGGANARQ